MDTIEKKFTGLTIQKRDDFTLELKELLKNIFNADENNIIWYIITSFLFGSMFSKDYTKFAISIILKDNYKNMYNWILVQKQNYLRFKNFISNLKKFYNIIEPKSFKEKWPSPYLGLNIHKVYFKVVFYQSKINKIKGTIIYSSGDVYVGEIKDDKRHGKGRVTFYNEKEHFQYHNKDVYDEIILKSAVYDGEFKNNMFHGNGTMKFYNGLVYDGEWENGKKHGKGKMIYNTIHHHVYDGEWINDKMNGNGTLRYNKRIFYKIPDKYYIHTKNYRQRRKKNILNKNKVCMIFVKSFVYVGDFKNNNMHGKGTIIYSDGVSYDGDFENNKKHGSGTYKFTDSSRRYVVKFKNNRLVE